MGGYQRTNWVPNQVISTSGLNNLEAGLVTADANATSAGAAAAAAQAAANTAQAQARITLTWTGTAWPKKADTLTSLGIASYSGTWVFDSNGDSTATQPTELATGDDWIQPASGTATTGQILAAGTAGGVNGVTNATVENGFLRLPAVTPTNYPASGGVAVFSRLVGGRALLTTMDPIGRISEYQPAISSKAIAWAVPNGSSSLNVVGTSLTAVGTATAAATSESNVYTDANKVEYLVTTQSTTAVAGWFNPLAKYATGSSTSPSMGGFQMLTRFAPATAGTVGATRRMFVGLTSLTGTPTDAQPSTLADVLGVGCDSADTNWQIMYRTGTGTVTKVDTGFPKNVSDRSVAYGVAITVDPGYGFAAITLKRFSDNTSFTAYTGSTIPAAATMLAERAYASVAGTSSVIGLALLSHYMEKDR